MEYLTSEEIIFKTSAENETKSGSTFGAQALSNYNLVGEFSVTYLNSWVYRVGGKGWSWPTRRGGGETEGFRGWGS